MALLVRQGNYSDFNPDKLRPGEWAVVLAGDPEITDGRSVFICFSGGVAKRMATRDDVIKLIDDMSEETIAELTQAVNVVIELAEGAAAYADQSGDTAMQRAAAAETAANTANAVANDLTSRLLAGEFNGPPGPQGPAGADGADGVVNTIDGQFGFQVRGGHLYLIYVSPDDAPDFRINEGGHLILTIQ